MAGSVLLSLPAHAQVYNRFGPATGVLKGNTSTYQTTAAASSDIIALWTGSCSISTFLRGDGSCAAGNSGTVTSVALTMPSGFSVGGSPVTTSGTLAVTTALSGVLKGNGSGFTTAASSDVIALWSGTCNSSTFLRADGSCQSPGGGGTVTSITAGTGISASPGSPITSSGTLSVNQAFAPTWTAQHIFSLSGGAPSSAVYINSTSPALAWGISGAGSDQKIWQWAFTSNTVFNLFATNDAGSTNRSALQFTRGTGVAISDVTLGNPTDNPTYTFKGTGIATHEGNLKLSKGTPQILINNTSPAADNRLYKIFASGGSLTVSATNDADSVDRTALSVTRSGNAVATVNLGNTTDNPTVNVNGSAIPRMVWGDCFSTGTPGCSGVGGFQATAAFSSSSGGSVTVTLTGFVSTPSCTATSRRGAANTSVLEVPTINSSTVIFQPRDSATGITQNQEFTFMCVGT